MESRIPDEAGTEPDVLYIHTVYLNGVSLLKKMVGAKSRLAMAMKKIIPFYA
jgi:hypothetical protein